METIIWKTELREDFSFIEFELPSDLIEPGALQHIGLPREVATRRNLGLVISGRGPVWLYAYLVHLAHPFAWVATFDPRLNGGVVVMNHIVGGPTPGSVVEISSTD